MGGGAEVNHGQAILPMVGDGVAMAGLKYMWKKGCGEGLCLNDWCCLSAILNHDRVGFSVNGFIQPGVA